MLETAWELASNIYLRQDENEGQYVEIVLPRGELQKLIRQCRSEFPEYVTRVCELLVERDPAVLTPRTRLSAELMHGLWNSQLLGTVLAQQEVSGERAITRIPELTQAFGLAMRGRLRLRSIPITEL